MTEKRSSISLKALELMEKIGIEFLEVVMGIFSPKKDDEAIEWKIMVELHNHLFKHNWNIMEVDYHGRNNAVVSICHEVDGMVRISATIKCELKNGILLVNEYKVENVKRIRKR